MRMRSVGRYGYIFFSRGRSWIVDSGKGLAEETLDDEGGGLATRSINVTMCQTSEPGRNLAPQY